MPGWDDWPWAGCIGNKWLNEPSRIPVKGSRLERVREYYNFWLGTRLARLEQLKEGMKQTDVVLVLFPTADALYELLMETVALLPMCVDSGIALMKIIQEIIPSKPDAVLPDWVLSARDLTRLRESARAFDTALSIQFDHLDTYRVMPKGTHDTRKLIEQPELAFESLWRHLTPNAQSDWTGGSRCLAFDLTTACGFHCLRSMEAMAINYIALMYLPRPKQRDLGTYIRYLKILGAKDQAVDLMEEIRKHHRNPLMHPEDTLDVPQALAVFDLTKSAIIFLIQDMLSRGIVS
jgi:hypothetical protein